jgi:hypothetical protein
MDLFAFVVVLFIASWAVGCWTGLFVVVTINCFAIKSICFVITIDYIIAAIDYFVIITGLFVIIIALLFSFTLSTNFKVVLPNLPINHFYLRNSPTELLTF